MSVISELLWVLSSARKNIYNQFCIEMSDSLRLRWLMAEMPGASHRAQITFLKDMLDRGYDSKRVYILAEEYGVPLSRRYIQFSLPQGAAGAVPAWYSMIVRKYLTKNEIVEYNVTYEVDTVKMNIWPHPDREGDTDRIYELLRKQTWFRTPELKEGLKE